VETESKIVEPRLTELGSGLTELGSGLTELGSGLTELSNTIHHCLISFTKTTFAPASRSD